MKYERKVPIRVVIERKSDGEARVLHGFYECEMYAIELLDERGRVVDDGLRYWRDTSCDCVLAHYLDDEWPNPGDCTDTAYGVRVYKGEELVYER